MHRDQRRAQSVQQAFANFAPITIFDLQDLSSNARHCAQA
jgi:hypothetical protein